jgi:hypothetical protein
MSRGDHGEQIFRDDEDRVRFLETFEEVWLRTRTVVSRRWVARRLKMGHDSRVTWAADAVRNAKSGDLVRWHKRLEKALST